jgi:hypothetical protein
MDCYYRKLLLILFLFICYDSLCQVSTLKASIELDTLYNVLNKNTGQVISFKEVNKYLDGSSMTDSKCDNVIYLKYNNRFFKRNYGNGPDITWFSCNESSHDNQEIINVILAKYGVAYAHWGVFKISETIVVPVNSSLYGSGEFSVLKLLSVYPVDALSVYRRASVNSLKIDCIETNMNLSSAIIVNSWDSVYSNAGEIKIHDIVIVGNDPALRASV